MRTCVGCRRTDESEHMIRLVADESGEVVIDLAGGAFGRGAWVHARPECLLHANSRALSRSFRQRIDTEPAQLFSRVRAAAHRRVESLLASARLSGKTAAGSDAVRERLEEGDVCLIVVASDAKAAAASLPPGAHGKALVWGSKVELGRALGRGETGVVAVLDAGLARALSRAIALSKIEASQVEAATPLPSASVEIR